MLLIHKSQTQRFLIIVSTAQPLVLQCVTKKSHLLIFFLLTTAFRLYACNAMMLNFAFKVRSYWKILKYFLGQPCSCRTDKNRLQPTSHSARSLRKNTESSRFMGLGLIYTFDSRSRENWLLWPKISWSYGKRSFLFLSTMNGVS